MKLHYFIWGIQIIMLTTLLIFSLIPLITVTFIFINHFYPQNFTINVFFISLALFLGFLGIFGIITLRLEFRGFITAILSLGIIFNFSNPYFLALGIILSWLFYESWFLTFHYRQLDQEYESYPSDSIERRKLHESFRTQFGSTGLLAWITLSISWAILMIASNFYIEVGEEFGTLGISISVSMLVLLYLVGKFPLRPSTIEKS